MSAEKIRWSATPLGGLNAAPGTWYTQAYLDRRCEEILFEFLN